MSEYLVHNSPVVLTDNIYQVVKRGRLRLVNAHFSRVPNGSSGIWTIILEDGKRYRNQGVITADTGVIRSASTPKTDNASGKHALSRLTPLLDSLIRSGKK